MDAEHHFTSLSKLRIAMGRFISGVDDEEDSIASVPTGAAERMRSYCTTALPHLKMRNSRNEGSASKWATLPRKPWMRANLAVEQIVNLVSA